MIAPIVVMTSVLVFPAAGCASNVTEPADAGQPAPSASAAPPGEHQQASDETISVRISDGKVMGVPGQVEVNRGSRVRIEVTSDRSDEVHIHGYDKTVKLVPGQPGAVQFVAEVPGVFEVETHDSGLLLFQLVVR
jgi:hypothetical protein